MALKDLLTYKAEKEADRDDLLTRENLLKDLPALRRSVAYWRVYPDRFVDFLCGLDEECPFSLYFYQRVLLRAFARHRYTFITLTRGASKSFTAILWLMINAILYPGSSTFVVSGVKQQSAQIIQEKVDQLCSMIPALEHEIVWDTRGTRARTKQTKDAVEYSFRNGSSIRNIVAGEQTRGLRFQGGLMEECISLDQDVLSQVVIPTLNVDRRVNGEVDPNEPANKKQMFITTAGYKSSSSYDNLLTILCRMVVKPKEAMVVGGDWRLPMYEGLLAKDFVKELKADGSFNEATFEREYGSAWCGEIENAFFSIDKLNKYRVLNLAEKKYNEKLQGKDYYVMGVDVGRRGCTTEVVIIKATWARSGAMIKQVVNLYTYEAEHFGMQAIQLKRIFKRYKCKCCVVDGNGLGAGLVDFLIMDQIDPETGETLHNWGVVNDPDGAYKRFQTDDTVHNAMYVMKANQTLNSEMYGYVQSQLMSGKLRFLIDEMEAKSKLMDMKQSAKMTALQKDAYLRPYLYTSVLFEQMMNLVLNQDGALLVLKQASSKIKKDKFSALIYGLYYCKMEEDRDKKHRDGRGLGKMMLFTKHKWSE